MALPASERTDGFGDADLPYGILPHGVELALSPTGVRKPAYGFSCLLLRYGFSANPTGSGARVVFEVDLRNGKITARFAQRTLCDA